MGQLNADLSGVTPPFNVTVRKVGETTGNRCTANCNSFPLTFQHDAGTNQYYFILSDSNGCTIDSRFATNGTGEINCDVTVPNFTATFTQPTCTPEGTYAPSTITLTNITNAYRYKICYNTVSMNCAACSDSDGFITGTTVTIPLEIGPVGSRGVLLRVYKDSSCIGYKEFFDTMIIPNCETPPAEVPEFAVELTQPSCSSSTGGTVQPGQLKLTGITNATRYKLCYDSTFNSTCQAGCSSSDGVINSDSIIIYPPSPSQGITQQMTLRVFNGSGCTVYKDYFFNYRSQNCSTNELGYINVDITIPISVTSGCNPVEGASDYDIYATITTPEVVENGQRSLTKGGTQRNVPNGNDTPNVYISNSFGLNCGPGPFYRVAFNLTKLRADYPNIGIFTFELHANKIQGANNNQSLGFRYSYFTGVSAEKKAQGLGCGGATVNLPNVDRTDITRVPCYNSVQPNTPSHVYNTAISGYRKIATIVLNTTTNQATWTTA